MKKSIFTIEKGFEKATSSLKLFYRSIVALVLLFIFILVIININERGWSWLLIAGIVVFTALVLWFFYAAKNAPESDTESWSEQQRLLRRQLGKCINCGADLNGNQECNECGCWN